MNKLKLICLQNLNNTNYTKYHIRHNKRTWHNKLPSLYFLTYRDDFPEHASFSSKFLPCFFAEISAFQVLQVQKKNN